MLDKTFIPTQDISNRILNSLNTKFDVSKMYRSSNISRKFLTLISSLSSLS